MSVCKERPATLPPLDAIGLEPVDHTHAMSRGGSGHHRPSSGVLPSCQPEASDRRRSILLIYLDRLIIGFDLLKILCALTDQFIK